MSDRWLIPVSIGYFGARAAQASLRSLRKLGCYAASQERLLGHPSRVDQSAGVMVVSTYMWLSMHAEWALPDHAEVFYEKGPDRACLQRHHFTIVP
jgi:hypothetical protein